MGLTFSSSIPAVLVACALAFAVVFGFLVAAACGYVAGLAVFVLVSCGYGRRLLNTP
ncbi:MULTISPECIES: hypothetical protein [unclassified Achromobacter]|uniref:hypothetical protein n=1 Tax=unclassified Achromobacter TaxID=2626865 RepID=UPI0013032C87|nr:MULTISPECIES: hypothetical protein [unclassified Achromobacter]